MDLGLIELNIFRLSNPTTMETLLIQRQTFRLEHNIQEISIMLVTLISLNLLQLLVEPMLLLVLAAQTPTDICIIAAGLNLPLMMIAMVL